MNARQPATGQQVEQAQRFCEDPASFFDYSYTAMHSLRRQELEDLQLAALRYRFEHLYASVPMVKKLADRQGLAGLDTALDKLDDVVPMLFEHTMYKSYPPSILEKGQFEKLTTWLDKLTAHDLSGLDVSSCQGVTDWIRLLERETPLRVNHSSGTSGVMSFNPMSREEYHVFGRTSPLVFFQEFGDPPATEDSFIPNVHLVNPTYRRGANAFIRGTDMYAVYIAGGEERVHSLYPGRLDSDVLYLAARLRAAKAKGSLDSIDINPALLERQRVFEAQQARMPQDMEIFFERLMTELAGQRVFILCTWNMIYDLAKVALDRGIRQVFAPDSVVVSGGGAKGMTRPPDWQEPVLEFTGVPRLKGGYGMSETLANHVMCRHGNYHVAPWVIPFVLDPDTSKPLPRQGVVTGRAAFYDLIASSHWGGFITGDEITLHWDGDCPCGQRSVYLDDKINRYSEKRGGDDKISCAATPEAHQEAMDFLTRFDKSR